MPHDPHPTNAAALAGLEQHYATPDSQPPGYWDALAAELAPTPDAARRNVAQMLQGYYDLAPEVETVCIPRASLVRMLALLGEASTPPALVDALRHAREALEQAKRLPTYHALHWLDREGLDSACMEIFRVCHNRQVVEAQARHSE